MYGCLVYVQVMAGVTVNDCVSSTVAELTMYLEKVNGVVAVSLLVSVNGKLKVDLMPKNPVNMMLMDVG